MFIEYLFIFLIMYLLYKLVFDFIVPVYRTSAQMRDKINEMNQPQYRQQQKQPQQPATKQQPTVRPSSDDYIDFEEIK